MQAAVLVFVGGGLGSLARHFVNVLSARLLGASFPWGTLSVNVLGSFAMGLLAAWFATRLSTGTQDMRLFLMTGVLGGFTTFSAFSLDAVNLWERGAQSAAIAYIAASLFLSLFGLVAGLALVRTWA